jgi:polysaccharide biosynthesis/export protein VpsN
MGMVLALEAVSVGCAHRARETPVVQAVELPLDERLGVDDVFEVRVLGEPDLSGNYRVEADGMIFFPHAGRLRVAGMRPSEVQQLITEKLRDGYLLSPQLVLAVTQWNSRKINVLGQVSKAGSVSYFPGMTIVDAIAAAGGLTQIAAANSVRLRREVNGRVETKTYPFADISEGRAANVVVKPGDVLVVEERIF